MNLSEKMIKYDQTGDINLFNTEHTYEPNDYWGVCIELFQWLKLEHKRYVWRQEGRPTCSKPLFLHPDSFFTKLIPDFVENDEVFKHTLKIEKDKLYYSDEISHDEIRAITKLAFDYYNPEIHYG